MVNGFIILFGLTMLYLSTTSRLKAHVKTLCVQGLLLFLICAVDFPHHPWYTVAFLTFFFGTLFTTGDLGSVWMPILGWAVVLVFALILTILIIKKNKELKAN